MAVSGLHAQPRYAQEYAEARWAVLRSQFATSKLDALQPHGSRVALLARVGGPGETQSPAGD